jgi:predicted dehydrogenase/threonine dehydrogenase-like Zn-dependent dehydrogenase
MLLDFGKANWIDKARQQPDKVRIVREKVRTDGFVAAYESVKAKLDQPIALGYANTGIVIEAGAGVGEFRRGQRVVSNGPHAEVVRVQRRLCAAVPESVNEDHAAFTVVGAIALEGIRLAQPTLGESMVVTGLGLVGLLTVQLLRAHGCNVLGIDFDPKKLELARTFGAKTVDLGQGQDPVRIAADWSREHGVDAAIITAATKSNDPVHQAALMCRKRGRIVLTGVTGLHLSRDDFYKKELSLQVSCSYGPGRYDTAYEDRGQDYPYPYVRWTAQRNFEAVLDMMADGRLNVGPLITHRFPFERALEAYELIQSGEFHLGVLLEYAKDKPEQELLTRTTSVTPGWQRTHSAGNIGVIGAGAYASKILIPAFQHAGAGLVSIASSGGVSASHVARKFAFAEATTDTAALLKDERIDTVAIATRHNSHAALVCEALRAGKHVFVEKPLAMTDAELDGIENAYQAAGERSLLMVGFNRRFAPHVIRMKQLLGGMKAQKAIVYTVNAGAIPWDHWTMNAETGGGRILGEVCHFIDLIRFLVESPATDLHVTRIDVQSGTVTLRFADGSNGTIHYFTNGSKAFPKERIEVFCAGRILQLDNFRTLRAFGWPRFRKASSWTQDKGADGCVAAFVGAIRNGGAAPIPFTELIEVSRWTLRAANAI